MEVVWSVLRECKVYAMVGAICAAVWCAGFAAHVDERFKRTEWLAGSDEHPTAYADLDDEEIEGLAP